MRGRRAPRSPIFPEDPARVETEPSTALLRSGFVHLGQPVRLEPGERLDPAARPADLARRRSSWRRRARSGACSTTGRGSRPPPATCRTRVRPPTRSVTTAPIASRLLAVARQAELDEARRRRAVHQQERHVVEVVDDEVEAAVPVEVGGRGAARARARPARPPIVLSRNGPAAAAGRGPPRRRGR